MFPKPAPWQGSYPDGLSADMELEAFPVHSVVDEAVRQWPEHEAVVFRDTTLSFAELKEEVDRSAAAFVRAGVKPGDRVALLIPNSIYHLLAFFGALKAGATIVHLSPLDSPPVIKHKLTDSGARLLVTTNIGELAVKAAGLIELGLVDRVIVGDDAVFGPSPLTGPMPGGAFESSFPASPEPPPSIPPLKGEGGRSSAPSSPSPLRGGVRGGGTLKDTQPLGGRTTSPAGRQIITFADFVEGADPSKSAFPQVDVGQMALIQYTGGTTGMPKGAILTHRNLSSAVASYDHWFAAHDLMQTGEDRVLLFLPLFHIYALSAVMLRAVRNGQALLLHTRFDAETALDAIEAGATTFPGVPTMWIALSSLPGFETRDLSPLRYCASGGAPIPVEVARRLKAMTGLELLGGWGMTETSPAGTNLAPGRPDKMHTIGVPLPGMWMDVVALDDPKRALGVGETGELRIFGPNVTPGYLNRPEETEAAFSEGGLLTGDIGYMDEDGFFVIVDRKKDMIISGGFNVYPQMIEQAIYEHPDVEEALVIGVADDYRGEAAKAFVKLRAGAAPLTLEGLRTFLKGRVGPHEMPAALEIRDALPRTPVGKLSKVELKREEAERRKAAKAS